MGQGGGDHGATEMSLEQCKGRSCSLGMQEGKDPHS